ncbi:hypothetical protein [Pseudomonas cavernae]|uniref:hypothetical protein n=1 Tax=Pseudomonas cavernae TaxID=2320867 RepID=UPI0013C4FA5B|nr:hypothetical protein [Pseudomonas cavernae]
MHVPVGDNRYRVTRSAKLWVVIRKTEAGELTHFGINDSIERSVYNVLGRVGEYVQYQNYFHPLHPENEFEKHLSLGASGKLYFFSNCAGIGGSEPEKIRSISIAPFIYEDESSFPVF